MVTALIALLLTNVSLYRVLPSKTDPEIQRFDSPHAIFVDRDVTPRNELLLFLTGTNGKTVNTDKFCSTAAELGYQVINLMYPDDIAAAVEDRSTDPDAFVRFRLTIIEGKPLSNEVHVDPADSIENRLIKLLQYLEPKQPRLHWGQFLTADGQINWSHIAVSGLSQGAGHAALIATRHKVTRAVLFGGPKDFSSALRRPANWYYPSETPASLIFTFNHEQDKQGCNFQQQLEICRTMGLQQFGPPVEVEKTSAPFQNSHMLFTNYPGTAIPSLQAHTSVMGDHNTPTASDGSPLFKPVWIYMLTAGGG